MQDITTKTVREIALELPLTTRIFEEYKIDYCCGGHKLFMEACRNAEVEPNIVRAKIERALETFGNSREFDNLNKQNAAELIDHIIETHHVFTKKEIVRLTALMEKVSRKHGETHPELIEMRDAFQFLCDELTVHMQKEEMVLFPFIKTLEASLSRNLTVPPPHFGTVKNPIRMMFEEHDAAGDLLRKMREVSNDYLLPEGACPSYSGLYFGLQDLERDLHQHIHLENNILFAQAIALEEKTFAEESVINSSEVAAA